jgi:hypothetical protein
MQQILPIKQPLKLLVVNSQQILATSKNQALVFRNDPTECDDLRPFFTKDCELKQHKKLIGKNVDFKVLFQQTIHTV